ncbi:MAG TPA: hypothetical protein VME70_08130 [Mycobacteriales bacterium]|nr:hypothetical protein [Mycobacteriales bacterium]
MKRRSLHLAAGLVLYGLSDAGLLLAALGVDPWDVLHQGLARTFGGAVGTWAIIVGAVVLIGWIPLRQRPGVGTIANVVVIGSVIDVVLAEVPAPHSLVVRAVLLAASIGANGIATGLYIGAGLGPGPRDGLMTGIAGRGHSIRVVRTTIELSVLLVGWALGGNVGIGTVAYALLIGPIVHVTLPLFAIRPSPAPHAAGRPPAEAGRPEPSCLLT